MKMTITEACEILKGYPKSLETAIGELSKEGDEALRTIANAVNHPRPTANALEVGACKSSD